jgi:hypothetical protein
MQFGVIYRETWGSTQPYVALSTLEFRSCLFVFGGAHMVPNSRTSHKPLSCILSCLFRWLVDGASLPCLPVKTLSGEGSVLMWG